MSNKKRVYRPDLAEVDREYLRYLPDPNEERGPSADPDSVSNFSLWKQGAVDFEEVSFHTFTGVVARTVKDPSGRNVQTLEEYISWRQRHYNLYDQHTLAGKIRLLKDAGFSPEEIASAIRGEDR